MRIKNTKSQLPDQINPPKPKPKKLTFSRFILIIKKIDSCSTDLFKKYSKFILKYAVFCTLVLFWQYLIKIERPDLFIESIASIDGLMVFFTVVAFTALFLIISFCAPSHILFVQADFFKDKKPPKYLLYLSIGIILFYAVSLGIMFNFEQLEAYWSYLFFIIIPLFIVIISLLLYLFKKPKPSFKENMSHLWVLLPNILVGWFIVFPAQMIILVGLFPLKESPLIVSLIFVASIFGCVPGWIYLWLKSHPHKTKVELTLRKNKILLTKVFLLIIFLMLLFLPTKIIPTALHHAGIVSKDEQTYFLRTKELKPLLEEEGFIVDNNYIFKAYKRYSLKDIRWLCKRSYGFGETKIEATMPKLNSNCIELKKDDLIQLTPSN